VIHDEFVEGKELWKMRVNEIRKDKGHVWVIGVWFFETADVLKTHPNIR